MRRPGSTRRTDWPRSAAPRRFMVLCLLAEGIGQPREAAGVHPGREISSA
jgi:hypothetical protein